MICFPAWAKREEQYVPQRDQEAFVSRSLLRLMNVLFVMRVQAVRDYGTLFSPIVALLCVLELIFLCALSHQSAFLLSILSVILVFLATLSVKTLQRLLKRSIGASLASILFVLPAILLYSGTQVLFIPLKTFLTVTMLGLLTEIFPWHQLTAALRFFHVPESLIFILDTALRYIALLGRHAGELLTALKLRCVGKNDRKEQTAAFVIGVTFLKSREMSEEMFAAMTCRCFTGEYYSLRSGSCRIGDVFLGIGGMAFLLLYALTEGLIP